ncbi:lytic transglycosylase domain-containing protein [Demequina sp. NBRC 110057]|uniref:lytic transglycosylase domain-containing protein n=1 Tax=Demequina sp. NBRC 110057 TaxID=1570346 RepID=UPI001F42BCAC|nr:lytic transglycosylase domain-containing protein [Demequina sp. NBRC 110057]
MGRSVDMKRAARGAAVAAGTAFAITATGAIPAVAADEHRVAPGDTVSALATKYGTSVQRIVAANHLDGDALIVIGQTLTIPSVTASGTSQASATKVTTSGRHTVAAGDTVWDLAKKYGTSVSAITKANSLGSSATIRIGQTLTIPGAGTSATASSGGASTTAATSGRHTVAAGDTVWDLAKKYGTSVSAITKANSLGSSATIRIGQTLTIPGASGTATVTTVSKTVSSSSTSSGTLATEGNLSSFGGATVTYTVKSGDTLSKIAAAQGVTVASIAKANGLSDTSVIRIGQTLTISGGTPTGLVGSTFAGRTYAAGTVGAANQNKATLNSMSVPTRAQMQSMVVAAANRYGVDPSLAQAVAYQESGFNMRAVSPANAVGVMQVIPTTGEWASDLVGRDLNLLDPVDNVEAGVAVLKHLTRGGRSLDTAIAGYYQGETGVAKYGMYADTKQYVASVKSLMARF